MITLFRFTGMHLRILKRMGAETFVYSSGSKAMGLAKAIQKAMVACGYRDRGVKTANYHVLRETRSPALVALKK